MALSKEEMIDMVLVLGECERNSLLAARVYGQRYPNRRHPRVESFSRVLQRFLTRGSVESGTRNYAQTVRTDENEFRVLASVEENPHVSIRDIARETEIGRMSVQRILKQHKYHPYHVQLHQELLPRDFAARTEFCQWAVERLAGGEDFFKYVLFTDESTFHKNGFVNRHNFHYYDTVNPRNFRTSSQYRWTLNVWGGVFGDRVMGPYFFDGHLTGRAYLHFLQNGFQEMLEDVPLELLRRMWLQHDGAPSHSTQEIRDYLNTNFPNRWIGRGGTINWPARSPDLTKCDFFLWGFVKNKVYASSPTTAEDMKERITNAFREITPDILVNVDNIFKRRMRMCIQENGRHFEQLL